MLYSHTKQRAAGAFPGFKKHYCAQRNREDFGKLFGSLTKWILIFNVLNTENLRVKVPWVLPLSKTEAFQMNTSPTSKVPGVVTQPPGEQVRSGVLPSLFHFTAFLFILKSPG